MLETVARWMGGMDDGEVDAPITTNGRIPNLFRGLLSYRPRARGDSRENFLTEAFAYVLAMDTCRFDYGAVLVTASWPELSPVGSALRSAFSVPCGVRLL